MCFSAVQGTLNAFVPIIVASLAGVGLARAGLCAAAAQIGAIVGRLCWGVIADRVLAPRTTLGLAGVLMAATALVLASITPGHDFTVVVAICIAFGFSAGGWGGVMLAETARLAPAGRIGPITSGVMLLNYSTVLLGAPIVGLVLELTGSFVAALATVAITAAIGSLLATVGPRR
jgi:predicted MFS family arabinose efflux permease